MPPLPSLLQPSVLVLVAFTCAGVAASARAASDGKSQFGVQVERYEDAVRSLEAGEAETAVIHLKNLLTERPDYLPARLLLGRAQLKAGRPRAAVKEFLLAREKSADEQLVRVPLVSSYILGLQYEEALAEAQRALPGDPDRVELLTLAGDALLGLERLDEAEATFTQAIGLAASDPGPRVGMARVLIARGRLMGAATAAQGALNVAPDSVAARHILAEVWRASGDVDRALDAYQRVLELEPDHVQALLGRAAIHFQKGDNEAALADVEKVYTNVSNQPQAMYIEALIRARDNDRAKARELLDRVTEDMVDPSKLPTNMRGEVQLLAGAANFALGNMEQARSHLDAFLSGQPDHVGALKILGSVEWMQGNATLAVELLDRAMEHAPADVRLRILLARILTAEGNAVRAVTTLLEARRLAPADPEVRIALAQARLTLGNRRLALADLESAITLETASVSELFLLGVEYLKSGRHEEARQAAEVLMRRAPDHPTSHNLAGLTALAEDDRPLARKHFERSIELEPGYLPATNNLAQMDLDEKNPQAARARYEALLERKPDDVHALRELARIAIRGNDLEEAWRLAREARAVDSRDLATQLLMIDVALRSGKKDEALSLALTAERQRPDSIAVLMTLARTHLAMDAKADAVPILARAAQQVSRSGEQSYVVALLQLEAGDGAAAHVTLQRAVSLSPKLVPAHMQLVGIEVKRGFLNKALERARFAREKNPSDARTSLMEGDVLMRMGLHTVALDAYARSRDVGGMTPALAVRSFNAQLKLGRSEEAARGLEEWLAEHPDDLLSRRTLATHYMNAKQLASAIVHHEKLAAAQPEDALIHNNLAWLYHLSGDSRALEQAEKAYRLAPKEAGVLDTIGWILVREGNAERGVFYLREAQSRATDNPAVQFHLALGLERLGRVDEARRQVELLLASGTSFDDIEEAKALRARLSK